ncbi:MAG: precorrin-6y C5,15-methyltransferase (decarboxylating) subunit CbiE [Nocardioidaceae bacterium]
MSSPVTVVGIGADGWAGLGDAARTRVAEADVLVGGRRHLDVVPPAVRAAREPWPSPLVEGLPALLQRYDGQRLVVLASGDPYLSGVATNLLALLGPERLVVLPAVSSASLARARMGWSAESTDVVTVVGRDHDVLRRYLTPGRRLVVLSSDGSTPRTVAATLLHTGFGASMLTVLSDLGADTERRASSAAAAWGAVESPPLNVVCVEVVAGPGSVVLPGTAGLPDDAFEHDGQLTKRDVRASVLSRLAPVPGELLWDVGAGAGSVGIEWMRTDPRCRAVAVESHPDRAARIASNARRLGVPGLSIIEGRAPAALDGLSTPDAVFVGGGATRPGVLEDCWAALRPGGRLVVSAVTLETEAVLLAWRGRVGGELVRLSVEVAEPIGTFTGWSPARPVVLWSVTKPSEEPA